MSRGVPAVHDIDQVTCLNKVCFDEFYKPNWIEVQLRIQSADGLLHGLITKNLENIFSRKKVI